jgi:hyperosmotically inducible periplasmic protein
MKAAIGALVVAALVAGPISTRAALAQTTTAASTDSTLDKRIETRINADSSLKKFDIKVSVNNGVAMLTGTVPTEADRAKATQAATIPGVSRVDNQLLVDLNAATTAKGTAGKFEEKTKAGAEKTKAGAEKAVDKTKEGADKAWEKTKEGAAKTKEGAGAVADKTKEGAGKVADKTKDGLSKTGEVITDGWITTRVKSKFVGEDLLKDSDINVDTNNHVVTLTGTVMSAAARARAVAEAKEVEGVHQVVDRLTIGPKK